MSRPWDLECFDSSNPITAVSLISSEMVFEEEMLQSFDRGYKDGWDDAAKAHAEEQSSISAELAGNLQSLSFTYHEARGSVLSEMEGILKGLVSRILPETMVHSLGAMIVEHVRRAADEASEVDVEVIVCPENALRVTDLIEGMIAPPLTVIEEASLGEGQAFIRLGGAEQKIDLEAVLQGLSEAVTDFFEPPEQSEVSNG